MEHQCVMKCRMSLSGLMILTNTLFEMDNDSSDRIQIYYKKQPILSIDTDNSWNKTSSPSRYILHRWVNYERRFRDFGIDCESISTIGDDSYVCKLTGVDQL